MARKVRVLEACSLHIAGGRHALVTARCVVRRAQVAIASATFDGTIHMATNICLVSVLGYGGSLVLDGALTAGQLTSFLMYSLYAGINLASVSTACVYAGCGSTKSQCCPPVFPPRLIAV